MHSISKPQVAGMLLLIAGVLLAVWAIPQFGSLPNYQRIGLLVPFAWAGPVFFITKFRNWSATSSDERWRLVGMVATAAIFTLGSLAWYLQAPDVRG